MYLNFAVQSDIKTINNGRRKIKGKPVQTRQALDFNSISIEGERIRLVPISHQYADIIFAEFTDEITRYMVPATPADIGEVESFINAGLDNMANKVDIILVILKKETEEFLGVCGLHGRSTPMQPELGIWLKKSAHGNHYGQEAIRFLVQWSKKYIVMDYMIYPCDKDNIASRKIAEHLHGSIFREGQIKTRSGSVLNEVVYKIL
jgi:ribosomal-protein-alanine N-acetyltransferase